MWCGFQQFPHFSVPLTTKSRKTIKGRLTERHRRSCPFGQGSQEHLWAKGSVNQRNLTRANVHPVFPSDCTINHYASMTDSLSWDQPNPVGSRSILGFIHKAWFGRAEAYFQEGQTSKNLGCSPFQAGPASDPGAATKTTRVRISPAGPGNQSGARKIVFVSLAPEDRARSFQPQQSNSWKMLRPALLVRRFLADGAAVSWRDGRASGSRVAQSGHVACREFEAFGD